jgi:hypothetical protein
MERMVDNIVDTDLVLKDEFDDIVQFNEKSADLGIEVIALGRGSFFRCVIYHDLTVVDADHQRGLRLRWVKCEVIDGISFLSAERIGRVVEVDAFGSRWCRVGVEGSELIGDVLIVGANCRVGKLKVSLIWKRRLTIGIVSVSLFGGVVKTLLGVFP